MEILEIPDPESLKCHKLLDAAGRPVVARYPSIEMPNARCAHPHRDLNRMPVAFMTAAGQGLPNLEIWFEGMTLFFQSFKACQVKAPWVEGLPVLPILHAIKTASALWWVSSRGTLERLATEYEIRVPDLIPREGWRLVDAAVASEMIKQRRSEGPIISSELDEERLKGKSQAKRILKFFVKGVTR